MKKVALQQQQKYSVQMLYFLCLKKVYGGWSVSPYTFFWDTLDHNGSINVSIDFLFGVEWM
jgi:hypothetical protein